MKKRQIHLRLTEEAFNLISKAYFQTWLESTGAGGKQVSRTEFLVSALLEYCRGLTKDAWSEIGENDEG